MEVLKLDLTAPFMRGLVTKIINSIIRKKVGYDVDVVVNELKLSTADCGVTKVRLHVDLDAEMTNDELLKLIKTIGLG